MVGYVGVSVTPCFYYKTSAVHCRAKDKNGVNEILLHSQDLMRKKRGKHSKYQIGMSLKTGKEVLQAE